LTERDQLQQMLELDLDDLETRPIDEIRTLRADCVAVETGLSYLRRMVQGPLDITRHEQARRREGGTAGEADLGTLIDELPEVLSEGPRAGGVGRLPQTLEPTTVDPTLQHELDGLLAGASVVHAPDLSDAELAELVERLSQFERKVSERRRALFDRIDALQAELTRRYRTGEASVESLLD
jgi:hypothetical protein